MYNLDAKESRFLKPNKVSCGLKIKSSNFLCLQHNTKHLMFDMYVSIFRVMGASLWITRVNFTKHDIFYDNFILPKMQKTVYKYRKVTHNNFVFKKLILKYIKIWNQFPFWFLNCGTIFCPLNLYFICFCLKTIAERGKWFESYFWMYWHT